MAVLKNPAKARPMSILASDLAGNFEFDSKQTFPVMDMSSGTYDEGMSLYLQTLGIKRLENEYNAAVKLFETQLEEQEIAAKLQANLAAESAANMAVEAQPGLGTGAAAVASEGRQDALGSVYGTIEQNTAQAYQEGMQNLSENYQTELESILGKYDPATQTFSKLTEYNAMTGSLTEASMKAVAKLLGATSDSLNDDTYIDLLSENGLIEKTAAPGEYDLTSRGSKALGMLFASGDVDKEQLALDGMTLVTFLATQMMQADFASGYVSEEGESGHQLVSELKRSEKVKEYEEWIVNNVDNIFVSHWGMYKQEGDIVMADKMQSVPVLTDNIAGVDRGSGTYVTQLVAEGEYKNIEDCTEKELAIVKQEILSGVIPDGSFFTFQRGEMYDDDRYYYVKNDTVYKTEYTATNPPEVISLESATTRSFGRFDYAGTGEWSQDDWVNTIINKAKAGKIPDGIYINFNHGGQGEGASKFLYQYSNGNFIRVPESSVKYMQNGKEIKPRNKYESYNTAKARADNVIFDRTFFTFIANAKSRATTEYLDW